jgi:hypothetical protein
MILANAVFGELDTASRQNGNVVKRMEMLPHLNPRLNPNFFRVHG